MPTLLLARRRVNPVAPFVGHVLQPPPPPTASWCAENDVDPSALIDAWHRDRERFWWMLGADLDLAGVGHPTRTALLGLHAPTPWERCWCAWACARLGVEVPEEPSFAAGPFDASPLQDPLADWLDTPPEGMRVVVGADPGLEALGVARVLRGELVTRPESEWGAWCDDTLVLLPDDPARLATWRRVLESHGLPVQTEETAALADSPVARWLLAVVGVAGWTTGRVQRDVLRDALLAPLLALGGAWRSDLRDLLRTLRRPALDLAAWRRHVSGYFLGLERALDARDDLSAAEREDARAALATRKEALRVRVESIADALATPTSADFWRRLLKLLLDAAPEGLGVRTRVHAARVDDNMPRALEACLETIEGLALAAEAGDDAGQGDAIARHRALERALSDRRMRVGILREHAVRLQTWATWDGRGAARVVLAGLEEGGYPAVPARRTGRDRLLAEALGLPTPAEELARQSEVAGIAARRALRRLLLSWSDTDSQGSRTFPGALVAALPLHAATQDDEREKRRVEAWARVVWRVQERHLVPRETAGVVDPVAASLLAHATEPPPGLSAVEAETWAGAHVAARVDDVVQRGRRARVPGPYNGGLGTSLREEGDRYSATSLEVLGACPMRYFFSRVLRVEKPEDAGVLLEPIESGNLVHSALASAAQACIARGEAWDLTALDETALAARRAEVSVSIDRAMAELRSQQPTLGAALASHISDRWKTAANRQLAAEARRPAGGLFAPGPCPDGLEMEESQLEALVEDAESESAKKDLKALQVLRASLRWLAEVASTAEIPSTLSGTDSWYRKQGDPAPSLNREDIRSLAGTEGDDRDAVIADLREKVLSKSDGPRGRAQRRIEAAWAADRATVPPRVVAAEWSFGRIGHEASDPTSVTAPLVVPTAGEGTLELHGQVDRVDAAPHRPALAVVDYKTGARPKGTSALAKGFGRGTDLQLPVYAAAIEQLYPTGGLLPARRRVETGRLAFVRKGKEGTLATSPDVAAWEAEDGTACDTGAVLRQHLAHAATRLESGNLLLKPRHCPLLGDGDAHCDYQDLCGLDPVAAGSLRDPAPQPFFELAKKPGTPGRERQEKHPEGNEPLDLPDEAPTAADARAAHEAALLRCRDETADLNVSAGAGSGKTTALVGRYVAALEAGAHPREVLAITFTRKATAEMRSRIRAAVRAQKATTEEARSDLRDRLRSLAAAPILTIDALAGLLVSELSERELEVATVSAERTTMWIQGRLLEEADALEPDVAALLTALPPAAVGKVLGQLVDAPDALAELAELSPDGLVALWRTRLDAAWPELGRGIASCKEDLAALRNIEVPQGNSRDLADRLEAALGYAVDAGERLGGLGFVWALARAGLSGKRAGVSPELLTLNTNHRSRRSRWGEKGPLGGLAVAVKGRDLVDLEATLRAEARLTLTAVRVARRWESDLRAERLARGQATFQDVMREAIGLLESPTLDAGAVAERLPFRQIMVDELQDTDGLQVRLVESLRTALRRGGLAPRLFRVGDPKQSIYRFRGAEVDVFAEQLEAAGEHERLTVCWRSKPELTRSLDRLFQRLLAGTSSGDPADPLAAVPWEPLAPRDDSDGTPRVELLIPQEPPERETREQRSGEHDEDGTDDDMDGDDADQAGDDLPSDDAASTESPTSEESTIATRLAALVEEHPDWSIALLTHSWARATRWGAVLQRAGLAAFVQGGSGLLETPEVRAVLDVLDALESEDDDLAWLGLLRGPLVGLSDPGLLCLRRGWGLSLPASGTDGAMSPARGRVALSRLRHGFAFDALAAIAAMGAHGPAPSEPARLALVRDGERLAGMGAWWSRLRSSHGRVPLAATVSELLERSGLRTVLHARGASGDGIASYEALRALSNLRALQGLVDAVEAEANRTPAEMVRQLRQLCAAGEDPANGGANLHPEAAIVVTTVHQAKGLEWDVVLLPDLARATVKGRSDDLGPVRLAWRNAEGRWERRSVVGSVRTEATDPFATTQGIGGTLAAAASRPWERAENRRLLYVACTRARRLLVLSAPWPTGTPAVIERNLTRLRAKRAPGAPFGLRHAASWYEDLVVGLGLRPPGVRGSPEATHAATDTRGDEEPGLPETDGTWRPGRDFTWVRPQARVLGLPSTRPFVLPAPEALGRAAHAVESARVQRLNPSQQGSSGAPPQPTLTSGAAGTLGGTSPFGSPIEEGHAVHRLFELWGYRSEPSDAQVRAAALTDLPPGADLAAREAWVRAVVRHALAGQPTLVAELRAAASAGRLFHEVGVLVPRDPRDGAPGRWEGSIDLLWQDDGGAWHLLDYKAAESRAEIKAEDPDLGHKVRHYHPQVAAYADALAGRLPGGAGLASWGLWFLKDGALVRWGAAESPHG